MVAPTRNWKSIELRCADNSSVLASDEDEPQLNRRLFSPSLLVMPAGNEPIASDLLA